VELVLWYAGGLAIGASLLSLLKNEAWWIRIFDFPRIQIATLALIVLAADLALRTDPGLAANVFRAILITCVFYQGSMIYPYTAFARKTAEPAQNPNNAARLGLLFANVKQDNRNAGRLRSIIRDCDPDVVLIIEADEWWRNELNEFARTHRFTVEQPQDNTYGMILYSRLRVVSSEVLFRVQRDVPSIRARVELPCGVQVELHCLHPKPPVPQEQGRSTERDAELLIVGRETRAKNIPIVVLGDLNDVAWSRTNYLFQRISGLLDPRIGRGLYNTFDARYPILRFPLDHFFHSNHFRLITLRRLPYFGSDHFPMYIALSYEPDAAATQEPAQPAPHDEQQATEKIEKTNGTK
jgi:endonuclease/exonuclease/phosphatase (EEP) superfamily protein YafD